MNGTGTSMGNVWGKDYRHPVRRIKSCRVVRPVRIVLAELITGMAINGIQVMPFKIRSGTKEV